MASGTAPRALVVLAVRLFSTCSRRMGGVTCSWLIKLRLLISYVFYKESTLFFDFSFWLHQGRIPRHTCRFYCCLAAHQRTRKKDSAEPSFPIPWTPPHPPGGIRCGGAYLLPRAWGNIGSCIPVLPFIPSSEFYLAVCVRAGIVRVSVGLLGLYRTFFIIGGIGRSCLRLRGVFAMFFRRICADREWIVSLGG